jgi:hypothetical protein
VRLATRFMILTNEAPRGCRRLRGARFPVHRPAVYAIALWQRGPRVRGPVARRVAGHPALGA